MLLIYLTTVKQSNNNAESPFEKKINKATHGYLITLAWQSRGDMLYVVLIQRIRKKCFGHLFTNSETMDNGHWKCHQYWMLILCLKGEQAYTRLFGFWPFGQGWQAIYLPKYKCEEKIFW